jgi:hypothetical protein
MKAIELCVNRFDDETKTAFIDLYTKVDADTGSDFSSPIGENTVAAEESVDKVPF